MPRFTTILLKSDWENPLWRYILCLKLSYVSLERKVLALVQHPGDTILTIMHWSVEAELLSVRQICRFCSKMYFLSGQWPKSTQQARILKRRLIFCNDPTRTLTWIQLKSSVWLTVESEHICMVNEQKRNKVNVHVSKRHTQGCNCCKRASIYPKRWILP